MAEQTIDVELLSKMFLAGADNLEAHKDWINDLNVFPVPDGDTGTNMSMTIFSAVREVNAIEKLSMASFAKAISGGSLRGARGNSGVILSQLLRGFARVIEDRNCLDKETIAQAFDKACETAYKAVMKPKEGTILTVAKGMAHIALDLSGDPDYDLEAYLKAIMEEGDSILETTPEMLPVLKQAGVVDSGGQGLMCVIHGAVDAFLGKEFNQDINHESASGAAGAAQAAGSIAKISKETEEEIKFGYCTEFIIVLNHPLADDEEMDLRFFLESIGDSIVMVADDEIVKIHVHTNEPGNAMQKGLSFGSLSRIKVDNMREEHEERLFKNGVEAEKTSAQAHVVEEKPKEAKEEPAAEAKETGFIAVSIGDGINEFFKELGVDYLIEGGQTMNPSTEDFLNAIEEVNARNIFLLPNNKNIILAASQAAELTTDKNILVVPTKTIPQGISALINYVPETSTDINMDVMLEAIGLVQTGEVTYAIRDTQLDGHTIAKGDYMGIGDAGILANGTDLLGVTAEMVGQMVTEESALICVYYGEDADEDEAAKLQDMLGEKFPDCETEILFGGQPVYYFLVSVE